MLPLRLGEVPLAVARVTLVFVVVVVGAVRNYSVSIAFVTGVEFAFTLAVLAGCGLQIKIKVAQGVGFLLAVVGGKVFI